MKLQLSVACGGVCRSNPRDHIAHDVATVIRPFETRASADAGFGAGGNCLCHSYHTIHRVSGPVLDIGEDIQRVVQLDPQFAQVLAEGAAKPGVARRTADPAVRINSRERRYRA
jgi:hypothetical protein